MPPVIPTTEGRHGDPWNKLAVETNNIEFWLSLRDFASMNKVGKEEEGAWPA